MNAEHNPADRPRSDLVYYGDEDYYGVSICTISHVAGKPNALSTCVTKAASGLDDMGHSPDMTRLHNICAEHLFMFRMAGMACGCTSSQSEPHDTQMCHFAVEQLNKHIPVVAPLDHSMPFEF